ncbi:Undecaprenyl diphosphate synthase [Myriangium duriaei CBS 260.36]|uniref:Alkyl transferase n=1 Tax=Myriangium duriaei CBS 260.36 TaxID=1168546 RepID=A0A9P4MMY9_9PEZI|nr:Undecaprenyl diphosphate synthase [Myriangium duriaei CBS 260.36]
MSSAHLTKLRKWLIHSPPGEWMLHRIRELLIGAMRQGPVPQHVAFVMDGNRRYARERRMETVEGHHLGAEALARILEVCYKSGVKVVTIYAFSVENFKRSKFEVDALMDMAKFKLNQVVQHGELLQRYGAKIQVLGQKSRLRKDVIEAIDHAVDMTKDNGEKILNVCFPYTSRHEMTSAIRDTVREYSTPVRPSPKRPFSETRISRSIHEKHMNELVEEQHDSYQSSADHSTTDGDDTEMSVHSAASSADPTSSSQTSASSSPAHKSAKNIIQYPDPENITAATLDDHTWTANAPPLDLLIRTSGVQRLSDFMLWQCHEKTEIVFLDCLWPEFDLWQFLPVMVEWQWKQRQAEEYQTPYGAALKAN